MDTLLFRCIDKVVVSVELNNSLFAMNTICETKT